MVVAACAMTEEAPSPPRVSVALDERSFARDSAGVAALSHLSLVAVPEGYVRIEAGFADPRADADPIFAIVHRDEAEALLRLMVDAYYRGLDAVVAEELVALKLRFGVTGFEIALRRDGMERALNCPPSTMLRLANGLAQLLDKSSPNLPGPSSPGPTPATVEAPATASSLGN